MEEKILAIKAITWVRQWGGIVEHPECSKLWQTAGVHLPGKQDSFGGYTLSINQSWFGHRAQKRTLLYIVGCSQVNLPPIPISFDAIERVVRRNRATKNPTLKHISRWERDATPEALAVWLVETANRCAR
jgi:hypothetical protein